MKNLTLAALLLSIAAVAADGTDVPLPPPATHFVTMSPTLAIGGTLEPGAADALTARGFTRVIDLRLPEEGTPAEAAALAGHGLAYVNFPTDGSAPSRERLAAFTALIDAAPGQRTLLHCASGNRAGMMWALYRLEQGATLDQVLAEIRPVVTRESLLDIVETWAERARETAR